MNPNLLISNNWEKIKEETDRIFKLASGRKNVSLGTGIVPFETDPRRLQKLKNYVTESNSARSKNKGSMKTEEFH